MNTAPELLLGLSGINYAYRALPVLTDIAWQWQTGEQWALIGPNGAGKTTLAKLLSRQLAHPSGEIHRSDLLERKGTAYVCFEQQKAMCDRDNKLDDSEQRADAIDPGTTVKQLICGYRNPDAEVLHWAQRLGIDHILERGIRFISTGEMRKSLLLQAILSEPALLILDSPLDGLDRASQLEMASILEDLLASDLNVLLLYRSLRDLPDGISHVLALDGGQVLASGSRDAVLNNETVCSSMNPPLPALGPLPPPGAREYELAEAGQFAAVTRRFSAL